MAVQCVIKHVSFTLFVNLHMFESCIYSQYWNEVSTSLGLSAKNTYAKREKLTKSVRDAEKLLLRHTGFPFTIYNCRTSEFSLCVRFCSCVNITPDVSHHSLHTILFCPDDSTYVCYSQIPPIQDLSIIAFQNASYALFVTPECIYFHSV